MEKEVFDVIEEALAKAGFKILDGDRDSVIVCAPNSSANFEIKVEAIAG